MSSIEHYPSSVARRSRSVSDARDHDDGPGQSAGRTPGRLRVLYLMPQPSPVGGMAAYPFLDEELVGLAKGGVEVHFLANRPTAAAAQVHIHVTPNLTPGRAWRAVVALAQVARGLPWPWWHGARRFMNMVGIELAAAEVARANGIDLIHSHFAWPHGFGGAIAARIARVPLVASLRGTDILLDESIGYGKRRLPFFDLGVRALVGEASRTVYFSEFMRDQGIALGARRERCRVVRKGVDGTRFGESRSRDQARASLGLDARPVVLFVGGLIRRKGVDVTIEALGRLRERHAFQFVVCGDGAERQALEAQVRQLGLVDRVRFEGWVSRADVPQYFAACDIFALTSRQEAAGNVIFEAMSCGRPVVCTDSGGPGEYVRDGVTGFVRPVDDVAGVAQALGCLLEQEPLRRTMGEAGARSARTELTYERMVEDLIAIYREVCGATAAEPASMPRPVPQRAS